MRFGLAALFAAASLAQSGSAHAAVPSDGLYKLRENTIACSKIGGFGVGQWVWDHLPHEVGGIFDEWMKPGDCGPSELQVEPRFYVDAVVAVRWRAPFNEDGRWQSGISRAAIIHFEIPESGGQTLYTVVPADEIEPAERP